MMDREMPRHPHELSIKIGAEDWDYVVRTLEELFERAKESERRNLSGFGGGGGGSYSVVQTDRDVGREAFRRELQAWFEDQKVGES